MQNNSMQQVSHVGDGLVVRYSSLEFFVCVQNKRGEFSQVIFEILAEIWLIQTKNTSKICGIRLRSFKCVSRYEIDTKNVHYSYV